MASVRLCVDRRALWGCTRRLLAYGWRVARSPQLPQHLGEGAAATRRVVRGSYCVFLLRTPQLDSVISGVASAAANQARARFYRHPPSRCRTRLASRSACASRVIPTAGYLAQQAGRDARRRTVREFPRLAFGGAHLKDPAHRVGR